MLGVVNEAPVKTAVVNAASLYQVNTGLVTVVLLAVSTTEPPEHTEALFAVMSEANALLVTFTVTTFAFAEVFSHLLLPLTVR